MQKSKPTYATLGPVIDYDDPEDYVSRVPYFKGICYKF